MKELFPGFFKLDEDSIEAIWDNGLITYDTNILLNLYRYSPATCDDFIDVFKKLSSKSFLTNRVCEEFLQNRESVISEQKRKCDDFIKTLNSSVSKVSEHRSYPFLSNDLTDRLKALTKEVDEELSLTITRGSDKKLDEVSNIFSGKVLQPYSQEKLLEILEEVKARYAQRIPPGYKDQEKAGSLPDNCLTYDALKPYGDFLVWKQIIEHSKEFDKDIIFVLEDKKDDYWRKNNGEITGPRPELIKEFKNLTERNIIFYRPEKFLEIASKKVHTDLDTESLNEVRNSSIQQDLRNRSINSNIISHIKNLSYSDLANIDHSTILKIKDELANARSRLDDERAHLFKEIDDLENTAKSINSERGLDNDTRILWNREVLEALKSDMNRVKQREIEYHDLYNKICIALEKQPNFF
ncbi:PIN domain-containing protein [Spongiibacter sp.]|uniref:PIN domain-containing protein n=1 Tax=Spongiibacter sp. TaxID=2024860 RepID=UPI000C35AD86|nr:PIN domain-containing protein [Spongiibacter sp.]MBU71307.1 hypothetical protein [Spongiibacter sp.]